MRLNYAHAPGSPLGAMMEVVVNGEAARAILLDKPAGDIVRQHRVRIERSRFRPGEKVMEFRARAPVAAGEAPACAPLVGQDWFEVSADSELETPRLVEVERVPDLAHLLGPNPVIASGSGQAMTLRIGASDTATVGAAFPLAAPLSTDAGGPLTQSEVRRSDDLARRHAFRIGPIRAPDPRVLSPAGGADLTLAPHGQAPGIAPGAEPVDRPRERWREGLAAHADRTPLDSILSWIEAATGVSELSTALGRIMYDDR